MSRLFLVIALLTVAGCSKSSAATNSQVLPLAAVETSTPTNSKKVVSLTPVAVNRINEIRQQAGDLNLRVGILAGGCQGFTYDLKFDDNIHAADDYANSDYGFTVVVDKKSALYLQGATIDFQTTSTGAQGFKFDNPNAVRLCSEDDKAK